MHLIVYGCSVEDSPVTCLVKIGCTFYVRSHGETPHRQAKKNEIICIISSITMGIFFEFPFIIEYSMKNVKGKLQKSIQRHT